MASIAGASQCSPTSSDVEGPFYLPDTPYREEIAPPGVAGERLNVSGYVLAQDCKTPVQGVLIEVWHTDARGNYKGKNEGERFRGRMRSKKGGSYSFSTIMPGRYLLGKSYRPAHIHFRISHPGYETLITQLYFKDDPYLSPKDPCGAGCRSGDPARIMALERGKAGSKGSFNIILKKLR